MGEDVTNNVRTIGDVPLRLIFWHPFENGYAMDMDPPLAFYAVNRGERAALFIFDEEIGLLTERALGLGIDLARMQTSGDLILEQIDAAEVALAIA